MIETIKKRTEFLDIAERGVKSRASGVLVLCTRSLDGLARVGFTASRKVGKAVVRNKSKRRLRHLVQESELLLSRSGCSFIFIANRNTPIIAFQSLKRGFERAICECVRLCSS